MAAALCPGREGNLAKRGQSLLLVRFGYLDVPLAYSVDLRRVEVAVREMAERVRREPLNAHLDLTAHARVADIPGVELDVDATMLSVMRGVLEGDDVFSVKTRHVRAEVTLDDLKAVDVTKVAATFETKFSVRGVGARRAHNIELAAKAIDGMVLKAGQAFSFNAVVSRRTLARGYLGAGDRGRRAATGRAQAAQREAVLQCFQGKLSPEVVLTVANDPWDEIGRMAGLHRCESLVLGLNNLADRLESPELERLMNEADCDVTILRAPAGWGLSSVRRILVPLGGGGGQNVLRARLLGGLGRSGTLEVRFLRVLRAATPERRVRIVKRQLQRTAGEEAPGFGVAHVLCRSDAQSAILEATEDVDLVVLGVQRHGRRQKAFGEIVLGIARDAPCATVLISRRG